MARLDVPDGPGGEAAMIWTLRPELGGSPAWRTAVTQCERRAALSRIRFTVPVWLSRP